MVMGAFVAVGVGSCFYFHKFKYYLYTDSKLGEKNQFSQEYMVIIEPF